MPHQETSHLYDYAVVWDLEGRDPYNEPLLGSPEEILVRWVNKEVEELKPDGTVIKYDASAVIAQDIPVGSILWQGRLADLPSGPLVPGLFQVQGFNATKDVKNRVVKRSVKLMRFNGTLPSHA